MTDASSSTDPAPAWGASEGDCIVTRLSARPPGHRRQPVNTRPRRVVTPRTTRDHDSRRGETPHRPL
jgi:hypothetical protein